MTTYINKNLFYTIDTDIHNPDMEMIITHLYNNDKKDKPTHTIISTYRRPHPQPNKIKNLQTTINQIHTKYPSTTITIQGDININLFKPTQRFVNFLTENSLYTTINTPTRYNNRHHSTTLIDVILTTRTDTTITAGTMSPPITDHLPIYTIFHSPIALKQQSKQKTLSTSRYEREKHIILPALEHELIMTNMNNPHTDPSQQLKAIQTSLQKCIEQHEKKPRQRHKQWCTPKFKKMIAQQHRLHKRRIQNPTAENIQKHKTHRNRLRKEIKQAKRKHITEQIEQTKRDPKKQMAILKTIVPKATTQRSSPTTIEYENRTLTDPKDIANAFNDHYITIGQKTTNSIPNNDDQIEQDPPDNEYPPFELHHTTTEEITKIMSKLNRNKASDIYKIKPTMIRDLTPTLAPILTPILNEAIDRHEYPDSLKVTKVIELYKKKSRTLPENYRPISLLPIIAKVFDTILNKQIMTHLTKHNIISPTQYAFRPNSSTTLALQTIINNIHRQKRKRQPTLAIYVDLSKAYDTISHDKLLHKLRHEFNFTEGTTLFFRSYFTNRKQTTHTTHAQSDPAIITHGIPQGSTLSTTFFLLYINNIIKTVPNSKVYTYADDTTLVITAKTIDDLNRLAQSELNSLISYFHTNNLVPNPTKTNYTAFYPIPLPTTFSLHIGDTTLAHNTEAPLLGAIIQQKISTHTHTITNIIKKLQPIIAKLKYAKYFLTTNTLKQLYYTHVYPHLIGSVTVWGTDDPNKEYIKPLIRTQKKIIRLIKNRPPHTHTTPLLNELGLLSITNLYKYRVGRELHPYIHPSDEYKNRPEHNHHYKTVAQAHNYSTRQAAQNHQYIPNPHQWNRRKDGKLQNIDYLHQHYAEIWNEIPQNIRDTAAPATFATELKKHLLSQQKLQ